MQVFLQTVVGGFSLGAIYALVAMGFSLVYRTMGLVNFAHGNVLMIGAYVASTFYLTVKLPFVPAVATAIVVTGLIGLVIERVLRPLENRDFDLMLIGTIGFGIVLEATAVLIWGATGRAVNNPVRGAPVVLLGARIRRYDLVVLAVTALAGGLAGPLLYVSPTMGGSLGIKGFAGAILGGFGSIPGAIAGGLAIGILDSFSAGHFQGYSDLVTFLVFTVLIMVRPTGIFGERTVNRA